jgi:hypothetical protein
MSVLDELNDLAGDVVVPRDVEHKGKTKTFFFRELSSETAENVFDIFDDSGKVSKAKAKGMRNRIIAEVLCNEDGSAAVTEKEIAARPASLTEKLQSIALEVNGVGVKKP